MVINTLAAMCAGFVLNLMFSNPPGWLNPEKIIPAFVLKMEKTLRKFYEESAEAQKMAGGVLVFFTLLIFAGIPLGLMILGYKLLPAAGLVLDCFFCWSAFSIRNSRTALSKIYRAVRSGNSVKAQKTLEALTGEPCEELETDDIIRKAVECAADNSAFNGVGPLFYMLIAGGFGGMFFRSISILNKTVGKRNEQYIDFGKPSRDMFAVLGFIPARICALMLRLDIHYLKLNTESCKKICRRDRKKLSIPNLTPCRCAMAGALGIRLTKEEYTDGELIKTRVVGEQLKDCQPADIYWANHLMHGAVFGCLVLFMLIRIIIAIAL